MKLKIGDKVKVIRNCAYFGVVEELGGLGKVGVVVEIEEGAVKNFFHVESKEFVSRLDWWFEEKALELVDSDQRSSVHAISSVCPRCNGEMIEKQTADYGAIKKCFNCGYC
jgi:hypothetical protein